MQLRMEPATRKMLIYLFPFGLSLSKPLVGIGKPFDTLSANGLIQRFPGCQVEFYNIGRNMLMLGASVWMHECE